MDPNDQNQPGGPNPAVPQVPPVTDQGQPTPPPPEPPVTAPGEEELPPPPPVTQEPSVGSPDEGENSTGGQTGGQPQV
ncbi:hypothetical protein HYU92_04035 [Candidatus Curtissbacteria bacterium]|nr:hypothetical protein [Candidatus Curtissbacteria bacterium]